MSDVEKLVYDLLKYDHVERVYKSRILSQKRNNKIYNYMEYLVHAPPGNYDAILVFRDGNDYQTIVTNVTVYNRGTARYFSYTLNNKSKQLVLVLLKSSSKR
jgi:hypothetical protein